MKKIQKISRLLQNIITVFMIFLPLFAMVLWFYAPIPNPFGISTRFFPSAFDIVNPISISKRFLGFIVSLIPLGIEMFLLYCLVKLFNLFERGKIFTLQNVKYIRCIGISMLLGEMIKPFYEAITTFIMHYDNPKGHLALSIGFDGNEINYILTSVIVLLISWVMEEACKLQEEQALTI